MLTSIWGLVFIAVGLGAKFVVGRRRFNRRNKAGVEEFSGYASALASNAFEKFLSIGGTIAILLGLMLAVSYFIFPRSV